MSGSEKVVWFGFGSDLWKDPDTSLQSWVVGKHDGSGFPAIQHVILRTRAINRIAKYLGIEPSQISWVGSPWGVDEILIRECPKNLPFSTLDEVDLVAREIYRLGQILVTDRDTLNKLADPNQVFKN